MSDYDKEREEQYQKAMVASLGRLQETRPMHYQSSIDPIKYLEANCSPDEVTGFLRGNVIKYITRFDKKGGLQDLDKGLDYLNKLRSHYASTGGA